MFAPAALTSVRERAPGAGRLARGPRGERRSGRRPASSGWRAAESAREAAPRLGASSCSAAAAASTSSQAASAGRLQGLSQHFPAVSHSPLRERGLEHTRTPRPQTARSLGKTKNSGIRAKEVAQAEAGQRRCADLGVPSERRPRGGRADAGGARPTQFVQRSPSARRPRRPDSHPWRRPCGLGRATAVALPHISGLRAEAEPWPLPHERLKARARDSGKQGGAGKSRATHPDGGEIPPNDPKEFSSQLPISLGHLCVCESGE